MPIIIQKIEQSKDYDEDFAIMQARYIVQDREAKLSWEKGETEGVRERKRRESERKRRER